MWPRPKAKKQPISYKYVPLRNRKARKLTYRERRMRFREMNRLKSIRNKLEESKLIFKPQLEKKRSSVHFYNLIDYLKVKRLLKPKIKRLEYKNIREWIWTHKRSIVASDFKEDFTNFTVYQPYFKNERYLYTFFSLSENIYITDVFAWYFYNIVGYLWLSSYIWTFNTGQIKYTHGYFASHMKRPSHEFGTLVYHEIRMSFMKRLMKILTSTWGQMKFWHKWPMHLKRPVFTAGRKFWNNYSLNYNKWLYNRWMTCKVGHHTKIRDYCYTDKVNRTFKIIPRFEAFRGMYKGWAGAAKIEHKRTKLITVMGTFQNAKSYKQYEIQRSWHFNFLRTHARMLNIETAKMRANNYSYRSYFTTTHTMVTRKVKLSSDMEALYKGHFDKIFNFNNRFIVDQYGITSFVPNEYENIVFTVGNTSVEHLFGHPSFVYISIYALWFAIIYLLYVASTHILKWGAVYFNKLLFYLFVSKQFEKRYGIMSNNLDVFNLSGKYLFPKEKSKLVQYYKYYSKFIPHSMSSVFMSIRELKNAAYNMTSTLAQNESYVPMTIKKRQLQNLEKKKIIKSHELLQTRQLLSKKIRFKKLEDDWDNKAQYYELLSKQKGLGSTTSSEALQSYFISNKQTYKSSVKKTGFLDASRTWLSEKLSSSYEDNEHAIFIMQGIQKGFSRVELFHGADDIYIDEESLGALYTVRWTHLDGAFKDFDKYIYDPMFYYSRIFAQRKHEFSTLDTIGYGNNMLRLVENYNSLTYYLIYLYSTMNQQFKRYSEVKHKLYQTKTFTGYNTKIKRNLYYKWYNDIDQTKYRWFFSTTAWKLKLSKGFSSGNLTTFC